MRIKLNSKVYPLEAILNASYAFIERAYIFLDSDLKANWIEVVIKPKIKFSKKQVKALEGEFMNELLDCALRYEVSRNNRKIREYIVGRALYSVLPEMDSVAPGRKLDYQKDPLGIALPCGDKQGKKEKCRKA